MSQQQKVRGERYQVKPRRGILLYGPPGNGKTELVRAAAGEHHFYLIKVVSKDFVASEPQIQLAKIQNIFDKTLKLSQMLAQGDMGIILFFDEFEALAGSHLLSSVVRGTLLNYMTDKNGLRSMDCKVLFMVATNFFEHLDEALTRKGRIDEHICLDNPSREIGEQILVRRFRMDESIEQKTVDDNTIYQMYQQLLQQKRQSWLNNELRKLCELPLNAQRMIESEEMLERQADMQTPSIAEIIDYFEDIKAISFYEHQGEGKIPIRFPAD